MPAPVELALATLLPTVSFLPADLITLSHSLLAQSRAKAASLKPEEEIARTYACCHIACERLKKRLDLEIGRPAPPVKPRVYEKLFAYLDQVLTAPTTPRKERRKDSDVDGGRGSGRTPATAVKRKAEGTTPTTGEKRRRVEGPSGAREKEGEEKEDGVPAFAMPMIRAICKTNGTLAAVPHILVGATSVVQEIVSRGKAKAKANDAEGSSRKRRRTPQSAKSTSEITSGRSGVALSRWPALLVAVYLLVMAKMEGLDIDDNKQRATRKKSAGAVKTFCKEEKDSLPDDIDDWQNRFDSNISFYILEAEDNGWLDMEWYQNVPAGNQDAAQEDDMEGEPHAEDENEDMPTPKRRPDKTPLGRREKHGGKEPIDLGEMAGAAGLQPGLGTMFQSAVDWLSDERRVDFARWKKGILKQMIAIEADA